MDLLPALREKLDHNYWARDRQLQACSALSDEQFVRVLSGSFPSVRATLAHMVAVEWLWLERWRGGNPQALIPEDEFPTRVAVRDRWAAVEREMRGYVEALDEDSLARPLVYVNTRGEEWTYPLWRMVEHLLVHQSYHRGQVTILLRMLGVPAPHVDFLVAQDMHFRL